MANVYSPQSIGVKPPTGGFQQGGWYSGRQYWGGTLSDPGVIHPSSNQIGAGNAVSQEVRAQSAAQQGVSSEQFNQYIQNASKQSQGVAPAASITPSPGGFSAAGTTGAAGATGAIAPPATIDLPKMYENLYASSGVKELQEKLSQQEKEFIEAKGKINDNPFLSEATRVGRIAKMEQLYTERTANLRNDVATKKADIETQLNLATKQFDINSQAAQQALNQFNALLSAGALNNASGEDIASFTRATGIPSSMIYSAIDSNKKKDVKTSVIQSTNDAGVVTVSVINTDTGEVVKQTSLGSIGNAQTGKQPSENDKQTYYMSLLREDAGRGVELANVFKLYSGYLDPNTILQLYNANSLYGPAKESPEQLSKYGVKPINVPLTY